MNRPLEGILILEFSQFMAGPTAGLKLADLGARVIKIERPVKGEGGRNISIKNIFIEGDSLVFHTINRNKESYSANLKDEADLLLLKKLIAKADVVTHNFRPGVMEKIGLDYPAVAAINPKIVYATVTGYGNTGPWANKPGQDLLIQSLSGLSWLSGTSDDGPVPFGLAVVDMYCAAHFAQGILAGLIKRNRTGKSVLIEVSLLESAIDLQFEVITTYLNDGGKLPNRSSVRGSGHPYLSAPYGIYKTADGYIALSMGDLTYIADTVGCDLGSLSAKSEWFSQRDEIATRLGNCLQQQDTAAWLAIFDHKNIWSAEVLNYPEFLEHQAYLSTEMHQRLALENGCFLTTTRSPLRINDQAFYSATPAPKVGAHTAKINKEFNL